jgi:uncharacterized protein YbjT (DUF2867 family)
MGSTDRIILVLGATGQQGGSVTAALRAEGWAVRALVRNPATDKAGALDASGIELVSGDLADPASLRAAMRGAYGVFSVQPSSGQGAAYGVSDEDEIRWGKDVATAAGESGVQHLVYSATNAAGPERSGMGHFDSKSEIESYIRTLDVRSTVIRPSALMEMLLPGLGLAEGCVTFFMRPDQPMQFIAAADIGKVVARIFASPETFRSRTIEIAGDAVTGGQVGQAFTRAAGRPIGYQRFPDSLLESDRFLGRLANLVDEGRLAGHADLAALRQEFPGLLTLEQWLVEPGKAAFRAALQAGGDLALR